MSVYSGFSTRIQEVQYYKLVENLIFLLQSQVLVLTKKYSNAEYSSWTKKFSNIYNGMKSLEYHKYLEPKLSESCRELAGYFNIDHNSDLSYIGNYNKYPKVDTAKGVNSIRNIATVKKKSVDKPMASKHEHRVPEDKLGMSHYYGKIMDNFLGKPTSLSPSKKKNRSPLNVEAQDFWLLDDKIAMLEADY